MSEVASNIATMVYAGEAPTVLTRFQYGQRGGLFVGDVTNPRHVDVFVGTVLSSPSGVRRLAAAPFGGSTFGYVVDPNSLSALSSLAELRQQAITKPISLTASAEFTSAVTDEAGLDPQIASVLKDPQRLALRADNNFFTVVPTDPSSELIPVGLRQTGAEYTSLNVIGFLRHPETSHWQRRLFTAIEHRYGLETGHGSVAVASFNLSGTLSGRRGVEAYNRVDALEMAMDPRHGFRVILLGDTGETRHGSMPMVKYEPSTDTKNGGWHLLRQGGTEDAVIQQLNSDLPHMPGKQDGAIARNHAVVPLPAELESLLMSPRITPEQKGALLSDYYSTKTRT